MTGTSLTTMAWRNLWRNRRRTLLTLSAIVFGVFLSVLMTALQDRNWADMIQLAARIGAGHVTLQHQEYLDNPTLSRSVRGTNRLVRLASGEAHVTRVVERITGFNMLSTAHENLGAGFIAVSPEDEDEQTLSLLEAIVEGEFFRSSTDDGIILGDRLASNLDVELGSKVVYTMTDKDGEIVVALTRVSGIVRTGSRSVDGGICLLPIDTVREVIGFAPDEAVAVFIDDQRRSDVVVADLRSCLLPIDTVREVIGFAPDEAIQVAVFIDDQRRSDVVVADLRSGLTEDVAALPWYELQPQLAIFIAMKVGGSQVVMILIAVLVAAGIFNTLFVSVMERIREFGIMLAVGFSPGQLFRLVMLESAWLAGVGLVVAAAVTIGPYLYLSSTGLDVTAILGDAADLEIAGVGFSPIMKVGIYPENVVLIGVAALLAVLLAGIYPAWKAGHADPVEALRLG